MAFVRNFDALKWRRHQAPGFGEIFFELFVGRQHARIALRHIDHRAPIKIGGAQIKLMGGLFAVVRFESGGEILVLFGDFGPFFVPAFEIEKFNPPRDAANVGVGMKRRDFHAHFELSAAR